MAKAFFIAGHGAGDPGACSDGYSEADLVRKLAAKLAERGGADVQVGDTSVNWYASDYISKGKCPAGVPVCELHMDSSAESAKGGHVIIKAGIGGADDIDNALASFISGFFPGRSVSIAERSDLANPNRAYKMGVNYRLVECGFISNDENRAKFIDQMDALADGILAAFGIGSKGSTSAPSAPATPAPSTPATPSTDSSAHTGTGFGGTYRCNTSALNVRDKPSLSGSVVATYKSGETVNLDDWYVIADGYVWGRYTSYSGATRYIAVGKHTGKAEANDYLIKVSGGSASSGKSIDTLAREVIAGKWGNDPERSQKLKAAGYDAEAVRKRVNQLL